MAAHQALDLRDLETAIKLLGLVEFLAKERTSPSTAPVRRTMEGLVAAYGRIWDLRHEGQSTPRIVSGATMATAASWNDYHDISLPAAQDNWTINDRKFAGDVTLVKYSEALDR